ncbi:MAG: hypothetical protein JO176_14960 [Acidimicrobiia bacterium]|nr:hypothetical protein [Acidimicrobiia bacterium]
MTLGDRVLQILSGRQGRKNRRRDGGPHRRRQAARAVDIGFPLRGAAAAFAYVTQLNLVFWAEGALGDIAAATSSAAELEGSVLQDTILTFLLAESGRTEEAVAALAAATSGDLDRYAGMSRLPALAFLANTSATLGVADHAAELYERLVPDERCHVVIPRWLSGGVVTGPVPTSSAASSTCRATRPPPCGTTNGRWR